MRSIVHPAHQLFRFLHNGYTLPPRQYRGKKSGNLNVLFLLELVRNRDRIVWDEARTVVLGYLFIEKVFEVQVSGSRFLVSWRIKLDQKIETSYL